MQFCATHGDYQFIIGNDDFAVTAAETRRLLDCAAVYPQCRSPG
jgi:hypothetical protein